MARVTVTGGAGNLGRMVALLLAERSHQVRVFDLPDVDYGFAEGQANISVAQGDLLDHAALARACSDADWVVHLAAIMPPLSETRRELAARVNVEGTCALLNVMPPATRLVFASSVATYGIAQTPLVGVGHPQAPIDYYGQTKVQNEKDIWASGRPATILRISGISVPALLEIPHPWFFSREQRIEFIHLHDAALAVTNCIDNPNALDGLLQIAGGTSWQMTGAEYSRAICAAFDTPSDTATYLESPNWPAWYETETSQATLDYQHHSFGDFCAELSKIYQEAVS